MRYWLRPFSGRSWQNFIQRQGDVVDFRAAHWKRARRVRIGDVFLCYLLRVKRWVGLLQVASEPFRCGPGDGDGCDRPVCFQVKPLVTLAPEHGVPMELLRGRLGFYQADGKPGQWIPHVRRSLTRYEQGDAGVLARVIQDAAANPINRPVDPRHLPPPPKVYRIRGRGLPEDSAAVVCVPEGEPEPAPEPGEGTDEPGHTEIQWRLLDLGCRIGLDVWAPRSDRGKSWDGHLVRDIPTLLPVLPPFFNVSPPIRNTIANIDVLWLKDGSVIAAFEVEHTTSVYSGLLRMSDLVAMSPLINIKLYLVAPDNRYEKFVREVARPTFASRETPLHSVCRFLPYSTLCRRLEEGRGMLKFLKPRFLDDIAELYEPADEVDD
jgi:hypothetical protein